MKTIYRSRKRVTREMTGSTHTLPILIEYAWSMARVCLEYGYSMARDCNATLRPVVRECLEIATPYSNRWSENGYPHHTEGQAPCAMSVRPLRTDSPIPTDQEFVPDGLFRTLLLLFVLSVMGIGDVWGEEVSEGVYYIKSYTSYETNFTPVYYLTPTINCFYNGDEDKPHLTTFKTNGDKNSLWRIVPVKEGNKTYYRLIHNATGKYLVVNDAVPELAASDVKQAHRKRVHLETIAPANLNDNSLFTFTEVTGGIIGIRNKSRGSSTTGDGTNHYYLNPQNGNKDSYRALNGRDITNFQGIIGFYGTKVPTSGTDGTDSRWKLYAANNTCANPVIQYSDASTIQISYPVASDTGWTIYYTTDGSDPSTNANRTEITSTTTILATGVSKIRAIATKTDWDPSEESVLIASGVTQMVQSKQCDAFYMVPPMVSGETYATTSNIPNAAMGWQFVPAGLYCGIQYYNIVNPGIDKYLYCSGENGSDEALIMKSSSEIISDANNETIDRAKFRLIVQDDGSYKVISKWWAAEKPDKYYVNKKNGNNGGNPLNLADGTNNTGQWNVIAAPSTPKTQFDASFASTTTSTKCYLIKSANATTYHLLPPTAEGGYATANTTGANPNWFLLPIEDNDEWIPSYHIKNGKTGEYLYFNSSDSKFYTNSSVSGNENNYKFIIVKSANTTYTNPFNVIPYALKDQANQEDNSLNRSGNNLTIGNSRNTPASLWQLEEGCLEPFFEQSGDNITISYISNTSDVYYTTDGSDPSVSGTLYENGNWPASEQHGIKAIAKLKDNSTVTSEEVTLLNQPEITLGVVGPYPYKGTPWEPGVSSVSVGSISTSTGYSVSYSDNHTNVGDVTVNVADNVEDNTFIWNASTTFTINQKAVTITAKDASKAYDGTALTESGFTTTTLETGDTHTFAVVMTEESTITNAGTELNVIATVDGTAVATGTETSIGNYLVTTANGTLTMSPKPLTITAKPWTITYGEEPTNNGVKYSEFAPGEDETILSGTLAYTYNYSQYDNAGDYNITPSGLTGANYDISYIEGTLTVNPKEVGLTWDETTTFVYDATSHAPTATPMGLLNNDEVGVIVTGQQTNVGENYTATASGLTGAKAGGYTLATTYTKNFSITPATLTVTAKNHTISYGDVPANNGVDYDGFAGEDNAAVLGGTLSYTYDYEQYDELGDYTITPSGLTSTNYEISFDTGTLTVKKKTVGLSWTNTSFTYDREAHQPSVTAVGTVNGEDIAVTLTAPTAINAGNYTATASGLTGEKVGHYELPTANTRVFTIAPKSLGDGDFPAEGITIKLTSEGELEYVKDGDITLTTDDYTCDINAEGSDQIVAVTGKGNYMGSLRGIYAQPQFYDVDGEGPGKAVAVYMSSRDVETFDGVDAYTVKSVNTFLGLVTVNKLEYIPKGVPVLLLSESDATGFVVSEKDEDIDDISEWTANSNLLKMAPTEGFPVEIAQAYMFYLGEFVLTKKGTINSGKFYILNPSYTDNPDDPTPAPVHSTLLIVEEETTSMADLPHTINKPADDVWYTLDGRRLSSKPVIKGLYINNGRKTVIK